MHPHPMVLYILNLKWMRWKEARRRVEEAVAADRGRRAVLVLLSEEKIIQRCSAEFLRLPTNIPWAAVAQSCPVPPHARPTKTGIPRPLAPGWAGVGKGGPTPGRRGGRGR